MFFHYEWINFGEIVEKMGDADSVIGFVRYPSKHLWMLTGCNCADTDEYNNTRAADIND